MKIELDLDEWNFIYGLCIEEKLRVNVRLNKCEEDLEEIANLKRKDVANDIIKKLKKCKERK